MPPEDAYRCFLGTEMGALVLEDLIIFKSELKNVVTNDKAGADYLAQFQLD